MSDRNRVERALKDSGAVCIRTKGKHAVWAMPSGRRVVISASPSSSNWVKWAIRDIEKAARAKEER